MPVSDIPDLQTATTSRNVERILFLATILLSCCIQNSTLTDHVLVPRFLTLHLGLLLLLLCFLLARKGLSIKPDKVLTAGVVYTFLYGISCFWAHVPSEAFFQGGKVYSGIILFVLACHLYRTDPSLLFNTAQVIVFLTQLFVLVGTVQLVKLPFFNSKSVYEVCSLSAHRNLFAGFLFLAVPFLLYGYARSITKTNRYFFLLTIIQATVFILILQTRAVWIGSLVALGTGVVLHFFKKNQKENAISSLSIYTGIAVVVCLGLAVLTGLMFVVQQHHSGEHIALLEYTNTVSVIERIQVWKNTLFIFQEHPFLGVGAGNWQFFYPKFTLSGNPEALAGVSFQRPHNDFLWVFAETGVAGGIAYLLWFAIPLVKGIRHYLQHSQTKPELLLFLSAVPGCMAASLFDFYRERAELLLLSTLLLAIVVVLAPDEQEKKAKFLPGWATVLLCSGLVFQLIVGYYRFRGEQYTVKMYAARQHKNWNEVIRQSKKAISAFYVTDFASMPLYWYEGLAYSQLKDDAREFASYQMAHTIFPYQYHILNNLGVCYLRNDQTKEAQTCFEESLRINPVYDEPKLNLALLHYSQKHYQQAFDYVNSVQSPSPRADRYRHIIHSNLKSP